jgi:tetratricopeptide (TPR) repeat protein/tRNA A-37 threonylcarbamoyl transferase component Bud32
MIGKTISHYRILGQIGAGGMGVVYVAEDTLLGRRVAIKIPHAGRDERHYRTRFLREARAISALSHKNIAAVYDYGEEPSGQPYIVMELVTGQTLGEVLTTTGLSLQRAVEIICDVAEALSEAHRRGIVHRDIKPSNVIINERGEVKVLDFGLAKQLDDVPAAAGSQAAEAQTLLSTQTRSDVVIGTPLYLSPEQARGARVDGRSDLFALGALLYECIAGRPAFSGSNVIEIGAQVLHVDPPPPSHFNQRVPPDLDRVALKALAKRPEDRYQTADQMVKELARVGARLAGSDTIRTRRLETGSNAMRTSALTTLTQNLRRPRFSPLALMGAVALFALGFMIYLYLSRPSGHVPEKPVADLYNQGVVAMRDGAYHRASLLFKKTVEQDENFVLAYVRLAEAKAEMDFIDAARDDLLLIQTLVERNTIPEQDRLYYEAVRATVLRNTAEAIRAYARLAELNRDSLGARLDLGRAYEKNNNLAQAINEYTDVATRDQTFAAAFLRLGTLHARRKHLAGANANFDRADKLYAAAGNVEGQAEVAYQRGRLLVELRNQPEVRSAVSRALELARASNNLHQRLRADLLYTFVEEERASAIARAEAAIQSAQTNGMHDLTALGMVTLGGLYERAGDLATAEKHYLQAIEYARAHKVRRYEAQALFQLGALRNAQKRQDEAQRYVEQARNFYLQGGYTREANQTLTVLGRIMRGRGDYEGALRINEELTKLAEENGDVEQIGSLRRDRGFIFHTQERLPQALDSYAESYLIYKRLESQDNLIYVYINQANTRWRLGLYDEAAESLKQASALLSGPKAPKKLAANVTLIEAQMALSRLRYAEAATKAQRARTMHGGLTGEAAVEAKMVQCLGEAGAGQAEHGLPLCEEALAEAKVSGDPALVSAACLAVAGARLAAGDARAALEEALRSHAVSAGVGQAESAWRALALAAEAARRAGDAEAARRFGDQAAESLQRLEQLWGAGMMTAYFARPDVRALRGTS